MSLLPRVPDTLAILKRMHQDCQNQQIPQLEDIEQLLDRHEAHEVHSLICVSTGHLTENDARILTDCAEREILPQYLMKYEYGFIIRRLVPHTWYTEFQQLGLSSEAMDLLQYVVQMGFDAIEFDCDGPALRNNETKSAFPIFDW